jgi:uncharacterized protein (TIGR02594 family)
MSDSQPRGKSFFGRTIDNKPWPAIVAVAFLASIGSQVAQTVAPVAMQYMRSLFPFSAEIIVFIKNKSNSAPVADAAISFIDPHTQKPIAETFKTNSYGMAATDLHIKPGTYAIIITYKPENDVEYELINPFEVVNSKQVSFEFSKEAWSPRNKGLVAQPVIGNSGFTIAQGKFPSWLSIAYKEIGQSEGPAPQSNPRILEYWKAVYGDDRVKDDQLPWTSAFIEWSLNQAGISGAKSGAARSWANWGRGIVEPQLGCIVVFWRVSQASGLGHVGFYVGEDADNVIVLGGNQNNSVSLAKFSKSRVLAYRMPN